MNDLKNCDHTFVNCTRKDHYDFDCLRHCSKCLNIENTDQYLTQKPDPNW
jgi:hypothetical protein